MEGRTARKDQEKRRHKGRTGKNIVLYGTRSRKPTINMGKSMGISRITYLKITWKRHWNSQEGISYSTYDSYIIIHMMMGLFIKPLTIQLSILNTQYWVY